MTTDEDQLRTKLASPPARHDAVDAEGLGFVGGGKHYPAADGDGLAVQGRVEQLLDRSVEGFEVGVKDGGCRFHPGRPAAKSWKMIRRRWPYRRPPAIRT
jgi:hypothetical protein